MNKRKIRLDKRHKILILVITVLIIILLVYVLNPLSYVTQERATAIYSSEHDGYIYEDDTESSLKNAWNDVIDDDDGTCDRTGDINIGTRTDGGNATRYRVRIYRGFLLFDTSSITGTVTTASLRIYVEDVYTQQDFDLEIQIDDDFDYPNIPLENDDYEQDYYSGNYGEVDSDDLDENEFCTITLDTDAVNKGGWTKLCLRTSRDINDSRGLSNKKAYVIIASGDDDDEAKWPALLINS